MRCAVLCRLLAHVVNTSLVRWLQSLALRHGLSLTLELGSLSLRQLGDVRITAGRWKLPQHPPLYATVEVAIDAIGFQLCKKKPITATVQGARIVVLLENETPADRERDRLAAANAPRLAFASAAAHTTAAAASASGGHGAPAPARRAEISSRSLAQAASSLERSVVDVTATAADASTRISRLESAGRWVVLKLAEWFAVSLQRAELCVRKGDVQACVELGFNVWCGDTGAHSPNSSRQIHLDLLGLAVRLEQVATQMHFRKAANYKPEDSLWRMPPLLQILPTDIAIDMQMQQSVEACTAAARSPALRACRHRTRWDRGWHASSGSLTSPSRCYCASCVAAAACP